MPKHQEPGSVCAHSPSYTPAVAGSLIAAIIIVIIIAAVRF
jgi:hypothetical protein